MSAIKKWHVGKTNRLTIFSRNVEQTQQQATVEE